jgi:hypothetical protein
MRAVEAIKKGGRIVLAILVFLAVLTAALRILQSFEGSSQQTTREVISVESGNASSGEDPASMSEEDCQIAERIMSSHKKMRPEYNPEGFRDYNYSFDKRNDTFRIIVIGASDTETFSNTLEEQYPKRLEALLNNRSKSVRYEVLNMGISGTHFKTRLCTLRNHALKYHPDMVILSSSLPDIIDVVFLSDRMMEEYYRNKTTVADKDKLNVVAMMSDWFLLNGYNNMGVVDALRKLGAHEELWVGDLVNLWDKDEIVGNYTKDVRDFKRVCDANNITCIGLFQPPWFIEGGFTNKSVELTQRQIRIYKDAGYGYIDTSDDFTPTTDKKEYTQDQMMHANNFGKQIIADSMYNKLILKGLLPNGGELEAANISELYSSRNNAAGTGGATAQKIVMGGGQ